MRCLKNSNYCEELKRYKYQLFHELQLPLNFQSQQYSNNFLKTTPIIIPEMIPKLFTFCSIFLISIATMINVVRNENSNKAREGVETSPSLNEEPHTSPVTWDPNHHRRESKDNNDEFLMAKRNYPHASTGTWSPNNPGGHSNEHENHINENENKTG